MSKKLKIQRKKLTEYKPDPSNANTGTERGHRMLDDSIVQDGAARSGLVDKDGYMIAGNQTMQALIDNGIEDVIEVTTTGKEWVIVRREDLDLSDDDPNNPARRVAYRDNRTGQLNLNWNTEQLLADLNAGINLDSFFHENELTELLEGFELPDPIDDSLYTRKVEAPIYEPSDKKPLLSDLYNDERTTQLIADINTSDLPQDEKDFLIIAAQRHTVLNFSKIADYYAHSSPDVQKLMEDSALVIIDFDRAIELGFVKLTKEIADLYDEDYPDD